MKSLAQYIREAEDNLDDETLGISKGKEEEKTTERGEIKFTIWKNPFNKLSWLDNNTGYQKIEYVYNNKEKGISIDFLLGFDKKDNSWKLYAGKPGQVSYDSDPLKDLGTTKFADAMIKTLDEVEEMLDDVKQNPDNWAQYYIHR